MTTKTKSNIRAVEEFKTKNGSNVKRVYLYGTIMWASVHKPKNKYRGKGQEYSITVSANEMDFNKLEQLGLNKGIPEHKKVLKPNKTDLNDKALYLTFTKPALKSDGTLADPITVVDKNRKNINELVGNKSMGIVAIDLIEVDGGQVVAARLAALQVLDLVPYTSNKLSGFEGTGPIIFAEHSESGLSATDSLNADEIF